MKTGLEKFKEWFEEAQNEAVDYINPMEVTAKINELIEKEKEVHDRFRWIIEYTEGNSDVLEFECIAPNELGAKAVLHLNMKGKRYKINTCKKKIYEEG